MIKNCLFHQLFAAVTDIMCDEESFTDFTTLNSLNRKGKVQLNGEVTRNSFCSTSKAHVK
jgi:hypothetical protein